MQYSAQPLSRGVCAVLTVVVLGLTGIGCDATSPFAEGGTGAEGPSAVVSDRGGGPPDRPGGGQGSGTIADVRVGHLAPDAPAVDVYVNTEPGEGDPTIAGLSYPTFAPNASGDYLQLESGFYDLTVTTASGGSSAVAAQAATNAPTPPPPPVQQGPSELIDLDSLELAPNRDYTILAIGEINPEGDEPAIRALPLVDNGEDDPALPPRDKTLVRFVHASPDAGTVNIAVREDEKDDDEGDEGDEGDEHGADNDAERQNDDDDGHDDDEGDDESEVDDGRLEGVTFGTASPYVELDPDDVAAIEVLKGKNVVLRVPADLTKGTKITVYVIGNATPEAGDEALAATTTLDATNPGGTGPLGNGDGDEDSEDD